MRPCCLHPHLLKTLPGCLRVPPFLKNIPSFLVHSVGIGTDTRPQLKSEEKRARPVDGKGGHSEGGRGTQDGEQLALLMTLGPLKRRL
jgi:hypothetical protein